MTRGLQKQGRSVSRNCLHSWFTGDKVSKTIPADFQRGKREFRTKGNRISNLRSE